MIDLYFHFIEFLHDEMALWYLKSFPVEENNQYGLQSQCHSCWWPGSWWSQDISSYDIGQVCQELPRLCMVRVKCVFVQIDIYTRVSYFASLPQLHYSYPWNFIGYERGKTDHLYMHQLPHINKWFGHLGICQSLLYVNIKFYLPRLSESLGSLSTWQILCQNVY